MKKILLSSLIAASAAVPAFAGVDNINYQAVIKDGNIVLADQKVALKFELLDNSENVVYSEEQNPTTNASGYVACQLGGDELGTIEWGDLTLRVSIDLGSGYKVLSNEAVSSVPTALYALRSADSDNLREEIDAFATMVENRIDKLQKQVDTLDEDVIPEIEGLVQDNEETKARINAISADVAQIEGLAEKVETINTSTETMANMLEFRFDKIQKQVDGIDEALEVSGTTDYSALVKDLEALKAQTEEGLAKVDVFADAVDAVEGLVQENEELKSNLKNISADVAQIEGLATKVEQLEEVMVAIVSPNDPDSMMSQINNAMGELGEAVEGLVQENEELKSNLKNISADVAQIEGLAKEVEEINTNTDAFASMVEERFDKVQGNIDANTKAIDALTEQTDAMATMVETRIDKLQKQVDGIDEEVVNLKETLNQLIQALKDLDVLPNAFNAGK